MGAGKVGASQNPVVRLLKGLGRKAKAKALLWMSVGKKVAGVPSPRREPGLREKPRRFASGADIESRHISQKYSPGVGGQNSIPKGVSILDCNKSVPIDAEVINKQCAVQIDRMIQQAGKIDFEGQEAAIKAQLQKEPFELKGRKVIQIELEGCAPFLMYQSKGTAEGATGEHSKGQWYPAPGVLLNAKSAGHGFYGDVWLIQDADNKLDRYGIPLFHEINRLLSAQEPQEWVVNNRNLEKVSLKPIFEEAGWNREDVEQELQNVLPRHKSGHLPDDYTVTGHLYEVISSYKEGKSVYSKREFQGIRAKIERAFRILKEQPKPQTEAQVMTQEFLSLLMKRAKEIKVKPGTEVFQRQDIASGPQARPEPVGLRPAREALERPDSGYFSGDEFRDDISELSDDRRLFEGDLPEPPKNQELRFELAQKEQGGGWKDINWAKVKRLLIEGGNPFLTEGAGSKWNPIRVALGDFSKRAVWSEITAPLRLQCLKNMLKLPGALEALKEIDHVGNTPLMQAIAAGDTEAANVILDWIDAHEQDQDLVELVVQPNQQRIGCTPLVMALKTGNERLAARLMRAYSLEDVTRHQLLPDVDAFSLMYYGRFHEVMRIADKMIPRVRFRELESLYFSVGGVIGLDVSLYEDPWLKKHERPRPAPKEEL